MNETKLFNNQEIILVLSRFASRIEKEFFHLYEKELNTA